MKKPELKNLILHTVPVRSIEKVPMYYCTNNPAKKINVNLSAPLYIIHILLPIPK